MDQLRAFATFAERLNFTHAAEELHISQPALHSKVQELGRALGAVLYVKRGRKLELTEQGREVARFGRELDDRMAGFLKDFLPSRATPVVLAAGQGAFRYLLGPAVKDYLEKRPLKLLVRAGDEALQAVREGVAHLAVAALPEQPGLASRVIRQVGHVVALPKQHPLARRKRLLPGDLAGEGLILPPPGRPHRLALEQHVPELRVAVEVSGWELTLDFVALGLGLAVVNDFCALPRNVVARPFRGLPPLEYRAFFRGDYLRREARELLGTLGTG